LHDLDSIRRSQSVRAGEFASLNDTEPNPDRTFLLGGHDFRFRAKIAANLIARFYDAPEAITPTCPHCGLPFTIGSPRPQQDALAAADAMIVAFLEPGQEEAWAQVRSDDADDPLTLLEVIATGNYLLGALTARPTGQQSGSGDTPATAGTKSTDGSPSPVQV
jgi:hypothetical protein